jgi:septal ring factor EnvC (AmiA/AmiB activator)
MVARTIVLLLVAMLPCYSSWGQDNIDSVMRDREEKVRLKEEVKGKLEIASQKEMSILKELEEIDRSLQRVEGELDSYKGDLKLTRDRIMDLRKRIRSLADEEKQLRSRSAVRLKAIYKFGYSGLSRGYALALLSSTSVADMITKVRYMSAVAKSDRIMLQELRDRIITFRRISRDLGRESDSLEEVRSAMAGKREEASAKRAKRENLLTRYSEEKKTYEATMAQLEESIADLDSLVNRLSDVNDPSQNMPVLSSDDLGELPWPVVGEIVPNSSDEFKGVTIKAPENADVIAVYDGIVEYAEWFDGLGVGLMIIVNHGNGYRTLYAHLSRTIASKGDKVHKGQVIAKVGDTGSLIGPALYFEVRHDLVPLDIRRWAKWER